MTVAQAPHGLFGVGFRKKLRYQPLAERPRLVVVCLEEFVMHDCAVGHASILVGRLLVEPGGLSAKEFSVRASARAFDCIPSIVCDVFVHISRGFFSFPGPAPRSQARVDMQRCIVLSRATPLPLSAGPRGSPAWSGSRVVARGPRGSPRASPLSAYTRCDAQVHMLVFVHARDIAGQPESVNSAAVIPRTGSQVLGRSIVDRKG